MPSEAGKCLTEGSTVLTERNSPMREEAIDRNMLNDDEKTLINIALHFNELLTRMAAVEAINDEDTLHVLSAAGII